MVDLLRLEPMGTSPTPQPPGLESPSLIQVPEGNILRGPALFEVEMIGSVGRIMGALWGVFPT